jgi:hypothetical protein
MRAKEFVNETTPSLADLVRTAIIPKSDPASKNQNATAVPKSSIGSTGPLTPDQASAQQQPGGGTQTPQDGVPPLGTTGQTASGQQPTSPNMSKVPTPADIAKAFQKGKQIDLGTPGKVTVGQTVSTPQGPSIEFDGTNEKGIGGKFYLPVKSLLQPTQK